MHRALPALLLGVLANAQDAADDAALARVVAILQEHDPLRDGAGAADLLAPDAQLDGAIVAAARSPATGRLVRQRALRLARALDLAQRLRTDGAERAGTWWLALDELHRDVPEPLRTLLLDRAGLRGDALEAALRQLAAAGATARTFCSEWNEMRRVAPVDAADRATNRRYDALEAALRAAGGAAVPALLDVLTTPPELSFGAPRGQDAVTARQQVRALFALGNVLQCRDALPWFVLHAAGPSLTQSSTAGGFAQRFAGEAFGADVLEPADDERLLAWWERHRAEHRVVLDDLVHRLARDGRARAQRRGDDGLAAQYALARLDRVLGTRHTPGNPTVELLRARLDDAEQEWLAGAR